MNKTDLINAVAEQADLTKKEAGSAVDVLQPH
jgi:DNA-binding protein HU-beta